jgi:hypothetical protein
MDTIATTERAGKHRVFHHAEKVASTIIHATVGYLMPNPLVRSIADVYAAEAFADELAARLTPAEQQRLVREIVALIAALTSPTRSARKS